MPSTTDKVLGTHDEFMSRMQDNAEEAPLAAASIAKYIQRDGLPQVGDAFRDAIVMSLDGTTQLQLSSLMKPGRPLVLNFGSCS